MKRMMVLAMIMALAGCQGPQIKTASTWELIDQEPVFEMLTFAKDSAGYEITVVKTFQRTEGGGVRLIDARQVGGPGLGYALANTFVDGLTDVASAGVLGLTAIEAASKIRPDNTKVTGVGGNVTGNSGNIEGGAGGAGGAGGNAGSVSLATGGDARSTSNATGGKAIAGAAAISASSATARQGQAQAQGQGQTQRQDQDQDQGQAQSQR